MQQLTIRTNFDEIRFMAMVNFLRSLDVEIVAITTSSSKQETGKMSVGLWRDVDVSADDLRTSAWKR